MQHQQLKLPRAVVVCIRQRVCPPARHRRLAAATAAAESRSRGCRKGRRERERRHGVNRRLDDGGAEHTDAVRIDQAHAATATVRRLAP